VQFQNDLVVVRYDNREFRGLAQGASNRMISPEVQPVWV
jgi:hypothetical protein